MAEQRDVQALARLIRESLNGAGCFTCECAAALDALVLEHTRQEETLRDRTEALTMLRSAWNAHMDRCTLDDELQAEVNALVPTPEQIQEWANAPSNTASAALSPPPFTPEAWEKLTQQHQAFLARRCSVAPEENE